MHILKVGLNYRTTPVEIREKLAFSLNTVEEAMVALNEEKSILENVILSTCNRTEIYVVADQLSTGRYYVKQFLYHWFNVDRETFSPYIEVIEDEAVVRHLFRLVAGLDSMILGETQILGQVRDSFTLAQKLQTTGSIFNELFKRAITFAKRSHKETAIGEHAVSVSYAAVQLLKREVKNFTDQKALVIGAGEMGSLALKNLSSAGCQNIVVMNRTTRRAKELASEIKHVTWKPYEELGNVLKEVDVLLTSTSSPEPMITKDILEPVIAERKNRPLYIVDIAVPRDVDGDVNHLKNIHLYDVDSLEQIVDENLETRKKIALEIDQQIDTEIIEFYEWIRTLRIVPVISALRKKAITIQQQTLQSILRKIPDLTSREKKVLDKHTKSIVNQLLKEPIKEVKELAVSDASEEALSLFIDIFGINKAVKEDVFKRARDERSQAAVKKQIKSLSFTVPEVELQKQTKK